MDRERKSKHRPPKPKNIFKIYDFEKLQNFPPVEEGDEVECYECGRTHKLQSSVGIKMTKQRKGLFDALFLIYRCRNKWCFGSIMGRLIAHRKGME